MTSGLARIIKALEVDDAVFGTESRVPYNNIYYRGYQLINDDNFLAVTDRRFLYKTHVIDKTLGHALNFSLRAFNKTLMSLEDKAKKLNVYFITVNFGDELTSILDGVNDKYLKGKSREGAIAYLNRKLRQKVFSKVGVEYYWFTIELGSLDTPHIHIVALVPEDNVNLMRTKFRQQFWIGEDSVFRGTASSVNILRDYRRKIFIKDKLTAELLELESQLLADPLWEQVGAGSLISDGYIQFQSVHRHAIDVGLADYLAKDTLTVVYESSRDNYCVSKALRDEAKPLINSQIALNKKLKKDRKTRK